MGIAIKNIEGNAGVGNVSTTLTSIYTVPAGATAMVGSILFTNIHTTNPVTCFVYVRRSGRAYDICICNGVSLAVGVTYDPLESSKPLHLEAGDILKVKAGTASSLDCVVNLLERT